MLLNYFFSEQESCVLPMCDLVVTNGEYTAELLRTQGYPPEKVVAGGSFRHSYLLERLDRSDPLPSARKRDCVTILVTPSIGRSEATELLWKVKQALGSLTQYQVLIKCHPSMPFSKFSRDLGAEPLPAHFTISEEPVSELMQRCDIIIYSSSTTCLEALAFGIPAVHVASEFTIDMDPLDFQPSVRWSSRTSHELIEAIENILSMPQDELHARRIAWRALVRRFFGPINEKTMRIFGSNTLFQKENLE